MFIFYFRSYSSPAYQPQLSTIIAHCETLYQSISTDDEVSASLSLKNEETSESTTKTENVLKRGDTEEMPAECDSLDKEIEKKEDQDSGETEEEGCVIS